MLTFLGILLNTEKMEAQLPEHKLQHIRTFRWPPSWARKNQGRGKYLPLWPITACNQTWPHFGSPNIHICSNSKLYHVTRLTKGFKSDLQWWHIFAVTWNDVSFIGKAHTQEPLHCIQTDDSGCGVCLAHYGCSMPCHQNRVTSQ